MPACRHCGSPSRGNPCFWLLDKPEEWASFDAPCDGDRYDERIEAADRRFRRVWLGVAVIGAVALGLLLWLGWLV